MSDRIHLAYCDQCGDEILEGDVCRVEREGVTVSQWVRLWYRVPVRTRYTCERCIAGEVRRP